MRWLWIALGSSVLVCGAYALWPRSAPPTDSRARRTPVAVSAAPLPSSTALAALAASSPTALPAKRVAPNAAADASREENELRGLEEEALRQIDVIPLLRAAGLDIDRLDARPDANDVLRHVAADELMTRSMMHDLLSSTIYPYGYPRDRALNDARDAANRMVAALSPEARIELLQTALVDGSSAEPEPTFYEKDSGRVFAEGERGDSPSE
jgi:hypothetical protein